MTYTQKMYHTRKAAGLCIRCQQPGYRKPNGAISPLCYPHFREKQSLKPRHVRDSDYLSSEPEPPREQYRAEYLQNLPALPTDCPKCRAQLFPCLMEIDWTYQEAVFCVNCSFTVDKLMWKNKLEGAA